jgi:hypothetical protein
VRLAPALATVVTLFACCAHAQVRVERKPSVFVDPSAGPAASELFARSGYFMIAGGVVLGGSAALYLEQGGSDQPVPARAVAPVVDAGGHVALMYGGSAYRVGMPAGLACPLGRFVARDGIIAYTVPKFMDAESRRMMMQAGLRHHRIAREFDGTMFEPLLRAADFAATTPLAPDMAQALTAALNDANSLDGFVLASADGPDRPIGSLINADVQVRYQVFLMRASQSVEVAGVPLRYFWQLDRSGAAGVFAVDIFAQNWPAGSTLSDLAAPGAHPTQYDIVNFYQVSGLFKELHRSNPSAFGAFVAKACAGTA